MHRKHRRRSFTHRGGNPSIGAGPDVADGKDPGHAGLEHQRISIERPAARSLEIRTGDDEALVVQFDCPRKCLGMRRDADEDEQCRGVERPGFSRIDISGVDSLQWPSPQTAVSSTRFKTSILSVARIRSTRYRDIASHRSAARTSIVTWRADREQNNAPCPAEFAPPTTHMSRPRCIDTSPAAAP